MLIVRPKCTCEEKSMETAAIVHCVRRRKSTINDQHPLPHTNAGHHPIISVRPSVSASCFAVPFNSSCFLLRVLSARTTRFPVSDAIVDHPGTSQHPVVQLLYDVTWSRHSVYYVQQYNRVLVHSLVYLVNNDPIKTTNDEMFYLFTKYVN